MAAALSTTVLLVVAACGGSDGSEAEAAKTIPPPSQDTVQKLGGQSITYGDTQKLTATYTKLLRSKDKKGFLATFDPSAKDARARMGQWFDNLLKLDAQDLSMSFVEATRGRDTSGKKRLAADMGLIVRIPGVDPVPLSEWYSFSFAPKDGKGQLKVVDVKGAAADESSGTKFSRYYRQAWDDGSMAVVRGKRAVLVGPSADQGWMRANVKTFDAAVTSQVGRITRAGITLRGGAATRSWLFTIQSPKVKDLHDYFGGNIKPTEANFAGFTKPVYQADAKTGVFTYERPATSRIVIGRTAMNAGVGSVVRHEMTHALQMNWQGESDQAPTWMVEGLAVQLEQAPPAELAFRSRAGLAYLRKHQDMPGTGFYRGNDAAVNAHYGAGYLGVAYLADRWGEKKLLRTIRRLENTDAPFEDVFGMDEAQIAKKAAAWAS
jgi:hypothetical protein